MTRILLAYDGSPGAEQAVELAAGISWPSDSTIRVISAIEPIGSPMPMPWLGGLGFAPELDAAISAAADEALGKVVRRLASPGRSVEAVVLRGRPASAIVDGAREFGADLVIVGSRGHGAIASLVIGSVSAEVVDHAPCPVLVARTVTVSQVLFATDGSPEAEGAEAGLSNWQIFQGLPIRVISVGDVVRPWTTAIAATMYTQVLEAYDRDIEGATAHHRRIAEDAAVRLRQAGRLADSEVRIGDPAAEILGVAENVHADLIVVGSRGRTGITRMFLGSVARNVLSGSAASVLIVRDVPQDGDRPAMASSSTEAIDQGSEGAIS